MMYRSWIDAMAMARIRGRESGRKHAVYGTPHGRYRGWWWAVVPAGGTSHAQHRAFLAEQLSFRVAHRG